MDEEKAPNPEDQSVYYDELSLLDDEFFAAAADGNVSLAEFIAKPFLELVGLKDFHPVSAETQVRLDNFQRHSVVLDMLAVDKFGRAVNVEVQKSKLSKKEFEGRMVFYTATRIAHLFGKGKTYSELPASVLIFITDGDFLGNDKTVDVARLVWDQTGEKSDKLKIIVANASMLDGEYPDIEYVLSEMSQRDPRLLRSDEVRVLHEDLKTTKEGRMKIEQARAVIIKNLEAEAAERQAALEETQANLEESEKKNKDLEEIIQRYRNAYGDPPGQD